MLLRHLLHIGTLDGASNTISFTTHWYLGWCLKHNLFPLRASWACRELDPADWLFFFSLPVLLFSMTPIIFSLHPPPHQRFLRSPIFLFLPYSAPSRARSLLRHYIHPFRLYEHSLQPAYSSPPPTHPARLLTTQTLHCREMWKHLRIGIKEEGESKCTYLDKDLVVCAWRRIEIRK